MRMIVAVLFLSMSSTPVWAGQAGNPPPGTVNEAPLPPSLPLGPIKHKPIIEGCTCTFQQPNARVKGLSDIYFISDLEWKSAWIHADQKDVPLKKVAAPAKMPSRKGQRAKIQFTGPGGIKVDLDLEVSDVCPPSQPCDTTGFEGLMTVTRSAKKGVTVITGSCSC